MVGQFKPIGAEVEDVPFFERQRRGRAVRVAGFVQQPPVFDVPDAHHAVAEDRGRPDVVGMEVRVHEVGHGGRCARLGGDLVDGPQQVVTDRGGRVDDHHAVRGGKEHGLVEAVGHPVQVVLDRANEVAISVQCWTECTRRNGRE